MKYFKMIIKFSNIILDSTSEFYELQVIKEL